MPVKNILVINGHPTANSYNDAIANAYVESATQAGATVKLLTIRDLQFNPNLSLGYSSPTELEPDLQEAQRLIQWANHLVWVHPVWWGGLPALLKGFIDRTFLPSFAFKYRKDSVWWDKLLAGRTGHIIYTLDQPYWFYWLINGKPSVYQLKKMTLEFCGISPVRTTCIGAVRNLSDDKRKNWLDRVRQLAQREAR